MGFPQMKEDGRVFENRAPKKMFETKGEEVTGV
jgi:hypothetical protein